MQIGFFLFLPSSVTEYSTVFSGMKNFTKLVRQLKQHALPLFCNEGVFRIVVDILLQSKTSFKT